MRALQVALGRRLSHCFAAVCPSARACRLNSAILLALSQPQPPSQSRQHHCAGAGLRVPLTHCIDAL